MLGLILKVFIFFTFYFVNVQLICPPPDPIVECFNKTEFDEAIAIAKNQQEVLEDVLGSASQHPGLKLTPNDPAFAHFHTHEIDSFSIDSNRAATILNNGLKFLKSKRNYTKFQLRACLAAVKIPPVDFCPKLPIECDVNKTNYYRMDGQCNNKAKPLWGAKMMPVVRILEIGYDDGIDIQPSKTYLESARSDAFFANIIKGRVLDKLPEVHNEGSTMLGQLLTHECLKTKKVQISPNKQEGGWNCCNPKNDSFVGGVIKMNEYCTPISVPSSDTCYGSQKINCLNYVKSLKSMEPGCPLNTPPEDTNFHTPYIDAELIYNPLSQIHLDANNGKFNLTNFEDIKHFIVEYDERSMQFSGLFQFLHNFLFIHNFIFDGLLLSNPNATSAKLSFESRKITTAIYQNVFIEFAISFFPNKQQIMMQEIISAPCYSDKINPQVSVEFNICLRLFHYFLRDTMALYNESAFKVVNGLRGVKPVEVRFGSLVDNLSSFQKNACGLKHGLLDAGWNLAGVGEEISCKFFAANESAVGHDMRSMDYQFGRNAGEPKYVEVLKRFHGIQKCNEDYVKADFLKHSSNDRDSIFRRVKDRALDIGFTLGVDLEDKEGEVICPTCAIIIAEQMKKLTCGDRFFFRNADFFTTEQKNAITNFVYRDVLCATHNCNSTRIQTEPFHSPGFENLKRPCPVTEDVMAKLNLKNWKIV